MSITNTPEVPASNEADTPNEITVTFVTPQGTTVNVPAKAGQTLMQAAIAAQVPGIDAECGGLMTCGTCHIYVCGVDALPAAGKDEREILEFVAAERRITSRLSCQIHLTDELQGLVVEIPVTQY